MDQAMVKNDVTPEFLQSITDSMRTRYQEMYEQFPIRDQLVAEGKLRKVGRGYEADHGVIERIQRLYKGVKGGRITLHERTASMDTAARKLGVIVPPR